MTHWRLAALNKHAVFNVNIGVNFSIPRSHTRSSNYSGSLLLFLLELSPISIPALQFLFTVASFPHLQQTETCFFQVLGVKISPSQRRSIIACSSQFRGSEERITLLPIHITYVSLSAVLPKLLVAQIRSLITCPCKVACREPSSFQL